MRFWFAHNVLFNVSNRFSEYLLECPSAEVRGAFAKLIVFIAHFSLQDGPCPSPFASPGPSSQVIVPLFIIICIFTKKMCFPEVEERNLNVFVFF